MSPQSRAASDITTFASTRDDGAWSGNACSGASSVAELAQAANVEYSLHKIESEASATPANPIAHQASIMSSRKRSSSCISSSPTAKNEPFLSSYGSAFLSGIFADIAHTSEDTEIQDSTEPVATAADPAAEPCLKKARATDSTSFGRQPKSFTSLANLAEGADLSEGVVSSPFVVSPRLNTSTITIQPPFNDQVRELQDMAFPSLPQIPITISSSSCSTASQSLAISSRDVAMEGGENEEQDSGPSYGWFVSTEDDTADQNEPSAHSMFLPDTKPDLAFKAISITAPTANEGNQDLEVQQALAADTIDDVLGDLF